MKHTEINECCGSGNALDGMSVKIDSIDDLNLGPNAKAAASSLQAKFPGNITFTSGRRSVSEQANAMAHNIVKSGNRKWIENTYVASNERKELQDWVDNNPEKKTETELSAGLLGIMNKWDENQRKSISYHMVGSAFDIAPVAGAQGDEIKEFIPTLPNLNKFLTKEGGLTIWHLQFNG